MAFLGITAHWIDINWQLHSMLIDFYELDGPHSAQNLAEVFMICITNFGIQTKV